MYTLVILGLSFCHNKKTIQNNSLESETVFNEPVKEFVNESITATEFVRWCSDETNQLNKSKEISEVKYHLKYLPKESMAMLDLRTQKYDYNKFQSTCEYYTELTYFNFKIEIPQASGELLKYQLKSPQQYEDRIKYMSFEMQNDIYLVQGGDTLRPGLYQFERIFEVAPFATAMMAFDNKKFNKEKEFTIVFNDKLFDKGLIKFNYKNRQLVNVPNIIGL